MVEKSRRQPAGVHAPFSSYSHSVVVDGAQRLIFCAGQVAADSGGNIVGQGDFAAQAAQVIQNLTAVLKDGGATLADVTKITVLICSRDHVADCRTMLDKYFKPAPPASTLQIISGLAHPDLLLEIEATAAI